MPELSILTIHLRIFMYLGLERLLASLAGFSSSLLLSSLELSDTQVYAP